MQVLESKHLLGFKGSKIGIAECVGLGSQGGVRKTLGDSDYLGLCAQHNFSVQGSQPWHKVSES